VLLLTKFFGSDLLSPHNCDYLTTNDLQEKRRSRSFSKADIHIAKKKQEALQKKASLFNEEDL